MAGQSRLSACLTRVTNIIQISRWLVNHSGNHTGWCRNTHCTVNFAASMSLRCCCLHSFIQLLCFTRFAVSFSVSGCKFKSLCRTNSVITFTPKKTALVNLKRWVFFEVSFVSFVENWPASHGRKILWCGLSLVDSRQGGPIRIPRRSGRKKTDDHSVVKRDPVGIRLFKNSRKTCLGGQRGSAWDTAEKLIYAYFDGKFLREREKHDFENVSEIVLLSLPQKLISFRVRCR